jgi:cell division protein FtsQ
MRPVRGAEARGGRPRRRRGPGPSKLAYRLQRAWAKPGTRSLATVYLPLVLLAALGWRVASDDAMRLAVSDEVSRIAAELAARPEFAVEDVAVSGGTEALRARVRRTLAPFRGRSSLTLDLEALRARIEAIGPVRTAAVRLDAERRLAVTLEQRRAAALWRAPDGTLSLVDAQGVVIEPVTRRTDRPRLPLILGEGAPEAVPEALALIGMAPGLEPRLRAMARVGERRWDMVLDRGLVLMLPERAPGEALAAAVALHHESALGGRPGLFERGISAMDLRVAGRPTVRLPPEASERLILERAISEVLGEET